MNKRIFNISVVIAILAFGLAFFGYIFGSIHWSLKGPTIDIVDTYSHDTESFTQGLEFIDESTLIESSGGYGSSRLFTWDKDSGETLIENKLDESIFAEGVTRVNDTVIQLTWMNGKALRWDYPNLDSMIEQDYPLEGWGACYNATQNILWVSNGSSMLFGLDPDSLIPRRTVEAGWDNLNELECVGDFIVANMWKSNRILVIDTNKSGGRHISLDPLVDRLSKDYPEFKPTNEQVLNGLAWNESEGLMYATGKNWPVMYSFRMPEGFIEKK